MAGIWDSQALSPMVTELDENCWVAPGQFRRGAVWVCAVSSQGCWGKLACLLSGQQSHPRVLTLSCCVHGKGQGERCPQQAALVTGLGNTIFQLQPGPWRPGLAGCGDVAVGFPWLPWEAGQGISAQRCRAKDRPAMVCVSICFLLGEPVWWWPGLQHLLLSPLGRKGPCSRPSSPQPGSAEPRSPRAGCLFPAVLLGLSGCVCILSRVS